MALFTQSLQLPQFLESKSLILYFKPIFYGKNKRKDGVSNWVLKSTIFPLFFIVSNCFVMRIFTKKIGLRP